MTASVSPQSDSSRKKQNFSIFISLLLSLLFLLTGCAGGIQIPLSPAAGPTSIPTSTQPPELDINEELPQITAEPETTTESPSNLSIWIPPQFGPTENPQAWQTLQTKIDEFTIIAPESQIDVRVKAADGPGGMLDSLSTAGAAAPQSLPSLALLSRADLEVAALKGLIYPLDNISSTMDEDDWYPYAQQLSRVDESTFGFPFAGNTLLFIYRPGSVEDIPLNWQSIVYLDQPVLFPASDPDSLVTLTLYQSAGGIVQNPDGRPVIQTGPLQDVLQVFADGSQNGVFPSWITQYPDDTQTWQAYQEERANCLITWSSQYLSELPVDTSATLLPSMTETDYTTADGWVWALSDPIPERQSISIQLAEHLVESEFLSIWSAEAGYLPPRPSALAAWTNLTLKNMLHTVSLSAHTNPNFETATTLSSLLKDATLQVIEQKSDPAQSAAAAAERLLPTDE